MNQVLIGLSAAIVAALAVWFIIRYFWTRSANQLEEVNVGQAEPLIVRIRNWSEKAPKNDYIRLSHINVDNSLPSSTFGFRIAQLIAVLTGLVSSFLVFMNIAFLPIPLVFLFLGLFYMPHYCKTIVSERELEWYKHFNLYHEISIEGETDVMSSVFFRLEPTIKSKEVREGLRTIISDVKNNTSVAIQDYPFPIVRKLEKIVRDLEEGDSGAVAALRGFYKDTYRDYKFRITKILAQTANKAVASTLPFLMFSLVIALLLPLMFQFLQNM